MNYEDAATVSEKYVPLCALRVAVIFALQRVQYILLLLLLSAIVVRFQVVVGAA